MDNQQIDLWRDEIDEARARRILSSEHFDYAVARGKGYCLGRAAGHWDANLAEGFAAYRTAARVAAAAQQVAA